MAEKASPIKRFLGLLKSEQKLVKNIYIYAVFNGLVALSLPLGIQAIISFIQTGEVTASWLVLVVIVVFGIVLAGYFQIQQLKTSEEIQQNIYVKSAMELAYRLPQVKSEKIYNFYAPELANRFFDTLTIQKGLSKILIDFTSAIVQIIFGLVLLSFYHPFFIFLGIILTVLIILIIWSTFYDGLNSSIKESKKKYETAHWLEEIARSIVSFKLFGKTKFHLNKTDEIVSEYIIARRKHFVILLKQYWSMIIFKAVLALMLLLIGGFLVIEQSMNLGQFVAAEIVILLILASVEKLILSAETIYDVLTAFDKLGVITELELEENKKDLTIARNSNGIKVEMQKVSFGYPDGKSDVVKDVSFSIDKLENACLIGENSSGKASLLNLLATHYKPTQGNIRYNDCNSTDFDLNSLRLNIGSFLKAEELFEGSLLDNIALNREDISIKDVMDVIKRTHLSDFLLSEEDGLETYLKPTGTNLSKSIVQKIILARNIVNKPKLLILGNTLNNVAAHEKNDIIDYLFSDEFNATVLCVTNDKYIAENSDKVIYLSKGRVKGIGKYEDISKLHDLKTLLYA